MLRLHKYIPDMTYSQCLTQVYRNGVPGEVASITNVVEIDTDSISTKFAVVADINEKI